MTMELYLIRHAQTTFNEQGRYAGKTDVPLSKQGEKDAQMTGGFPAVDRVFVSPMLRARQTAAILFPNADQEVIDGLREMDFGVFEGRTANEMADDARYRAWLNGGSEKCPGGENMDDFTVRAAQALADAVRTAKGQGRDYAVIMTHGGVIMALMGRFACPKKEPFAYHVENLGGYRIELDADSLDAGGSFERFDKMDTIAL